MRASQLFLLRCTRNGGSRRRSRRGTKIEAISDFTNDVDIIGSIEELTFTDFTFTQVGNDTQIGATGLGITQLWVNTQTIEIAYLPISQRFYGLKSSENHEFRHLTR